MNVKAMKELREYILAEPENYSQGIWGAIRKEKVHGRNVCKTIHCLAGAACMMRGWKIIYVEKRNGDGNDGDYGYVIKNGRRKSIDGVARRILGLKLSEAKSLFSGVCVGWSPVNRNSYRAATTPFQEAEAAAAELTRLIDSERDRRALDRKRKN